MHIKILGTRGEIDKTARHHAKKSGVLINNLILLDCGEREFLSCDPKYILITHLHPDHAYFVRHQEKFENNNIKIYAPEPYKQANICIAHKSFNLEDYKITPIPTIHSIKVKSCAYLISHENKKILYTGDMIWIEKRYHNLLKNLDLVITEASFAREGGRVRRHEQTGQVFGHTGIPNLIRLFERFTNKILFVHFGSWFYEDIHKSRDFFKHLARAHKIDLIIGYDGFSYIV